MKTGLSILFGRTGLNMRANFTLSVIAGGTQPLADGNDLQNENPEINYATYEPDYTVLDGTFEFMSSDKSIGYMSLSQSANDGSLFPEPHLQFDFNNTYSTDGLTLYFSRLTNDFSSDFTIDFYLGVTLLLSTNYTTGTSAEFKTNNPVNNFDRIDITFNFTNKPYRYIRLRMIDFANITRWSGSNIKNGTLIEQINPLSLELSSNEIEFTLFSEDADFSITNPSNEYAILQENEPIEAYEQIGDNNILLGRFYLNEWESLNEHEAHFSAFDAIILLDKTLFYTPANGSSEGGIYYYNQMLEKAMDAAGVAYNIDASFVETGVIWGPFSYNILPTMSCREVVQHTCLVIGAYASCARSRVVNIVPFELASNLIAYDYILDETHKGLQSPVKLKKAVTSVEILGQQYTRTNFDTPFPNMINIPVTPGTYFHAFDIASPIWDALDSTADITIPISTDDYGCYWIRVEVTSAGDLIINQAGKFDAVKKQKILTNGTLPSTTPKNVINIKDVWLMNPVFLDDTAQRIYDYYLQRYIQKIRLYASLIKAGDSVLIDTQSNKKIKGIVEQVEYNLTGGFIADLQIVGVLL